MTPSLGGTSDQRSTLMDKENRGEAPLIAGRIRGCRSPGTQVINIDSAGPRASKESVII
jgi:hypothetical protein